MPAERLERAHSDTGAFRGTCEQLVRKHQALVVCKCKSRVFKNVHVMRIMVQLIVDE